MVEAAHGAVLVKLNHPAHLAALGYERREVLSRTSATRDDRES
jgi:hypothetical protein